MQGKTFENREKLTEHFWKVLGEGKCPNSGKKLKTLIPETYLQRIFVTFLQLKINLSKILNIIVIYIKDDLPLPFLGVFFGWLPLNWPLTSSKRFSNCCFFSNCASSFDLPGVFLAVNIFNKWNYFNGLACYKKGRLLSMSVSLSFFLSRDVPSWFFVLHKEMIIVLSISTI